MIFDDDLTALPASGSNDDHDRLDICSHLTRWRFSADVNRDRWIIVYFAHFNFIFKHHIIAYTCRATSRRPSKIGLRRIWRFSFHSFHSRRFLHQLGGRPFSLPAACYCVPCRQCSACTLRCHLFNNNRNPGDADCARLHCTALLPTARCFSLPRASNQVIGRWVSASRFQAQWRISPRSASRIFLV